MFDFFHSLETYAVTAVSFNPVSNNVGAFSLVEEGIILSLLEKVSEGDVLEPFVLRGMKLQSSMRCHGNTRH